MQAITTGRPDAATVSSFRELLEPFRRHFDDRLAAWIAARPQQDALTGAVGRLAAAGGKRLRPALVWFAWRACGGTEEDTAGTGAVASLARAVELLHTYLLIHDDIMDHAATRRGEPTAHVEFARRMVDAGLEGDAADFGRTAAILAGDLAHAWAHELVDAACRELPAARRGAVERTFAAACQEVIAGQYQEIVTALRRDASEEELERVLQLKSGRYSVQRPVELGALAAGAGGALLDALSRYGAALGEAFQLQDDVLGTFGDSRATGKPVVSDLAEGKFTFLVYHALESAPPERADELRAALGDPELGPEQAARLRAIIEESGALERVRRRIGERLDVAREALAEAAEDLEERQDGEGRAFLAGLVDYVAERET